MKKISLPLVLLIFSLSVGISQGFVNSRHQWWSLRLRNLDSKKQQLIKNSSVDPSLIRAMDNEIRRARGILSVFESDLRDDGTLSYETRAYSEPEIREEVSRIAEPVFSVHYLSALAGEAGSQSNMAFARELVNNRLRKMVREKFGQDGNELIDIIMTSDIDLNRWKTLSMEIYMGRMINNRKALLDTTIGQISEDAIKILQSKNMVTNIKEVKRQISSSASERFGEIQYPGKNCNDDNALDSSWCWNIILSRIDRDFTHYQAILRMLGAPKKISLERIRYYHNNPAELESLVFSASHSRYLCASEIPPASPDYSDQQNIVMGIPKMPDGKEAINEISKLRNSVVLTISGREDKEYFTEIDRQFRRIIQRHTGSAGDAFFREEERIRLLREGEDVPEEGAAIVIKNENDFNLAKKTYRKKLHLLSQYRQKSLQFAEWVAGTKKFDSGEILRLYRYQIKRDGDYLNFISALAKDCTGIASSDDGPMQKKYIISIQRLPNIFKFIGYTLSPDRSTASFLNNKDLQEIKRMKADFTNAIAETRLDIRKHYNEYAALRALLTERSARREEGLKGKIAQHEIDILLNNALEYAGTYESLAYAEDAFTSYLDRFNTLKKEALLGRLSGSLDYSLKMKSIFPSVNSFDKKRILRERDTKKYLKQEADDAIARLITLLQFYKKHNVELSSCPSAEEIQGIREKLQRKYEVKIGYWIMNEANFIEIDKKAVAMLSQIVSRSLWKNQQSETSQSLPPGQQESGNSIEIIDPPLSFLMPRGWLERKPVEGEIESGIIKCYTSIDNNSIIRIVKIPLNDSDIKTVSEEWLKGSGNSLVEKKWLKKENTHMLWLLSKDRHHNIQETCALSKGGYAIIITGSTTRTMYNHFNKKFRGIINSLAL